MGFEAPEREVVPSSGDRQAFDLGRQSSVSAFPEARKLSCRILFRATKRIPFKRLRFPHGIDAPCRTSQEWKRECNEALETLVAEG